MCCRAPLNTRGLTLLEAMITLAVLAILGAMMVPGLRGQLEHQRLEHAAQSLAGDVIEARFLAAQKGQTIYIQAQPGTPWCWSVAATAACGCDSAQPCQIHSASSADHPGVKLLEPLSLSLDPLGGVTPAGGTSFESASGERLRVEVTSQGRPRVCAAAGNWPRLRAC